MSQQKLFRRAVNVTVGSLLLSGFDVAFTVKRSLGIATAAGKPHPNTCDLKVWNLSPDHQKALAQATIPGARSVTTTPGQTNTVVPVRIEAGYVGALAQIFLGELRAAQTVVDGPNRITELSTGDGDKAIQQNRISVTFGPATTAGAVMRRLLQVLGVGQGNLPKALQLLQKAGVAQMYVKGACLKGPASDHMTDLCRSAGLEWSIQDGQLQVLNLGQPLDGQAVLVAPGFGMVGSPTVDTKGILSVTTLMIPQVRPGVKISVDSFQVKGGYRVISVESVGDTFGNEWYHKIEADKY